MPNLAEEAMGRAGGAQPVPSAVPPMVPQGVADPMAQQVAPAVAPEIAAPVDVGAVTPEDQTAYDSAMEMASKMLHGDDKISDQFIASMQEDGQEGAVESIAGTVKLVLNRIEDEFQGELPETVILSVAEKIAELAMELGEEAGAFTLEPQQIDQAKGAVVRDLVETYGMDEADIATVQQGMSEEDQAGSAATFGGM